MELDGQISGNGVLTVIDSSGGGNGMLIVTNATNNYTGGTNLGSGTLEIGADGALGLDAGPLTFSGTGTLQATSGFTLADGLGDTRAIITPNDPTLAAIIDCDGNSVIVPGVISGAGGLTAIDSSGAGGTLTLSGANTFTGLTTVGGSTETLVLDNGQALQDSTFDTSGPGA